MQNGLKLDGSMRAVAIAIGAAIVTSVFAMLVPVQIFETITGATGISEIIPATGAPLGDKARALIAFTFGLIAFLFAFLVVRNKSNGMTAREVAAVAKSDMPIEHGVSFVARMKARIADFAEKRRRDGVTELSDLPKLRTADAHPDAPPRRPISAVTDFAPPAVAETEVVQPAVERIAAPEPARSAAEHIANMVDRLEAAVTARQEQLAKLEALVQAQAKPEIIPERVEVEIISEPLPRLEAVPTPPAKAADEIDDALRSALETLHRMNVQSR